ncbi:glycosyltransferase [Paraconexibacter antarcticus]|uniref:Glycosyltransferase n=1 Tax=Paraconexibacter antarcticus TaxID=2949664 RepID=A0ABY5DKN2_9ACTN|nr:glycosyltransferase [Paraconexibacter antarcticus]UTI62273.1 glycosyltransferase [Paraconexibacter antarcticus]
MILPMHWCYLDMPVAARAPSDPDLIVVLNGFPRLSETFVLNELLDLERRGVQLHIFALRHPEEIIEQDLVADLRARVDYLDDAQPARTIAVRAAHAALLLHGRDRYLSGVAEIVASPDFSRARFKQAALLAHRMLRLGAPPVYIHFAHKPATIGRFAALLAGTPYAMSAHAKDVWLTPVKELRAKVRGAEAVLACTQESRDHLQALAGSHTPVHLIHHGVEVPPAARPEPANDVPIVLAVGRLVEKKGYDTLLRAAALLRDRSVSFRLRIAGDGPSWGGLQRLVHELHLDDVLTFLGPLEAAEVRAEYDRADVFALACRQLADGDRDGLPNVLVEAMVRGLPVVATTLPGIQEAVQHGESGLLVAPDEPVALADALQRALADPGLRAALGAAARTSATASFDRAANLPSVSAALAAAGIVAGDVAG